MKRREEEKRRPEFSEFSPPLMKKKKNHQWVEKLTGLKLGQYARTKGKPYRFGTDEFVS